MAEFEDPQKVIKKLVFDFGLASAVKQGVIHKLDETTAYLRSDSISSFSATYTSYDYYLSVLEEASTDHH
jgi:hypothetical protein